MPKQTTSAGKMAARHAYVERLRAEEKAESLPRATKFLQSRIGRTGLASALLVAGGVAVSHEEPLPQTEAVAEATVPHHVYRTGGEGVWLHDGPGLEAPNQVVMPDGAQFNVDCFAIDDSVNGNPVWLHGEYNGQVGAVTDYYIDTHWDTTQDLVGQGIEECGVGPRPAPRGPEQKQHEPEQQSCYFDFKWPKKNLTFSYEGEHRYYGNAWQAAKNWSDLGIVSIQPAPEGEQGDIVIEDDFTLKDENNGSWYGRAYVESAENATTSLPSEKNLGSVAIKISTFYTEQLDDFAKTYVFTHEIGHVLGLAHPAACGIDSSSIMKAGTESLTENPPTFNKPQDYDKISLKALYG